MAGWTIISNFSRVLFVSSLGFTFYPLTNLSIGFKRNDTNRDKERERNGNVLCDREFNFRPFSVLHHPSTDRRFFLSFSSFRFC